MKLWNGLRGIQPKKQPARSEEGTGPAAKCGGCGEQVMKLTLREKLYVCPHCDHHQRMGAWDRIAATLDIDSFEERDAALASLDPLEFQAVKSYREKLNEAYASTRMLSAMVSGRGEIERRPVAFGVTDSDFIMGSMGSVVGEKFTRLAEYAIAERLPLIVVSGSGGGARMYEGLYSLMQMAKTSAALARLREAGLPFLSICTDCTMAGVWASWAGLGDIIIAEPKALIGFTGPRVIKATINAELPEGFQLSEFLLAHGQVDMIVSRAQMRARIADVLAGLLGKPAARTVEA